MSIKIEEDVQTMLVKIAGEYQAKTGKRFSISDTIKELINEHRMNEQVYSHGAP